MGHTLLAFAIGAVYAGDTGRAAMAAALPKLSARENSSLERDYRANLVSLTLRLDSTSRQAVLDSRDDKEMKAAVKRMNGISKDTSKKLWDATH